MDRGAQWGTQLRSDMSTLSSSNRLYIFKNFTYVLYLVPAYYYPPALKRERIQVCFVTVKCQVPGTGPAT